MYWFAEDWWNKVDVDPLWGLPQSRSAKKDSSRL